MSILEARPAAVSRWRRQDWVLTSAALTLAFIGSLLVWSATQPRMIVLGLDPQNYLKKHILTLLIAFALGWLATKLNYPMLRAYAPIVYGASILGLIAVLILGSRVNGIRAWIQLPLGFTLQPAEFTKVAVIVIMSFMLAEPRDANKGPGVRDVIQIFALVAVPLALIMLQPDLGTALVISVTMLGVLLVGRASRNWFIAIFAGVILVGGVALSVPGVLADYQKNRIEVFIDPTVDPSGAGYNLTQVRIAIGSGGWTGTGLFEGPQTNGRFVPEQQTDFIYSVAGEELGFVGAGLIIVLLGIIVWRALRIAGRAPDLFGRLAAAGIGTWIGFQAFENIGMSLGIMPMTGVPLPFVSYGGSSMFALAIGIGLLQQIHLGAE
mgnify:FL=1